MRNLNKNKQNLKYALFIGKIPIYEKDSQGNIRYIIVDGQQIPIESGDYEEGYAKPVDFLGNISFSGGEVSSEPYGIDVGKYDATVVTPKGLLSIDETTLIWYKSEVAYKDTAKTIVDPNSADYRVKKITPSINEDKYLLERIVK